MPQKARKRKVLMVVENLPAPADPRVWPESLALRDYGFDVSIICPKGRDNHREAYRCIDGIHIYRYALPTGHTAFAYLIEYAVAFVMTFWLTLKVWRQRGIDIVHTANPPDIFFPIGWLLHLVGKKFVFDQHELAPELFEVLFIQGRRPGHVATFLHRLMLYCERRTYRAADLVIVTNESFRQVAIGRGWCKPQKVVVVRNGPDIRRVQQFVSEPDLKLGRRFLLVYLGVMGAQDGIEYALRALHCLVHERGRRDIALALLGDGGQAPALRGLARDLGLDKYVHFTGWVGRDEINRYLAAADVGLVPDPYNTLNDVSTMIKTMEYMAAGKPLVAFDLTETRFSAQEAALYAKPNNVENFADRIEVLLDDDSLRVRMGAAGRTRIEKALSWEHSTKQLLSAYEQMLGIQFDQVPAAGVSGVSGGEDISAVV